MFEQAFKNIDELLRESFDDLKAQNPKRTTAQDRTLQERTFCGKEKKSLAATFRKRVASGLQSGRGFILLNPSRIRSP